MSTISEYLSPKLDDLKRTLPKDKYERLEEQIRKALKKWIAKAYYPLKSDIDALLVLPSSAEDVIAELKRKSKPHNPAPDIPQNMTAQALIIEGAPKKAQFLQSQTGPTEALIAPKPLLETHKRALPEAETPQLAQNSTQLTTAQEGEGLAQNNFRNKVLENLASNKKADKSEATEMLAKLAEKKLHIRTIENDAVTEMWSYSGGIYVPNAQGKIKALCRKILGKSHSNFIANEVIAKVTADTFISAEEFFAVKNPEEIPVQNGILNIATKQLTDFSPNKVFFCKLPVRYVKDADCPQIKNFLSEVVSAQDRLFLEEFSGYLLVREAKYQKALMCLGSGGNGKGILFSLWRNLLGAGNCVNLSLEQIENDSFCLGLLLNKHANLGADIDATTIRKSGTFKQLTGEDIISANRKFLPRINLKPYAKQAFSCNELPVIFDNTYAFFRRWNLIQFPKQYVSGPEWEKMTETEREKVQIAEPDFENKLIAELPGFLNLALEGYARIKAQKGFSISETTEHIKTNWQMKADSFMAFCFEKITSGVYADKVLKETIRKEYSEYCTANNLKPRNDKHIREILTTNYGASESQEFETKQRYWRGVILRDLA